MAEADDEALIGEGTVIRTHKWGDPITGTVVSRKGETICVAWHNSFVEDELSVSEVEVWADAPQHLREWRGGVGVFTPGQGTYTIEPLPQPGPSEPTL